jgi:AP-3 complex subunit beta
MDLLLRYARTMLPRPGIGGSGGSEAVDGEKPEGGNEEDLDKDVKLLLDSVEPVFQSRNPAVGIS